LTLYEGKHAIWLVGSGMVPPVEVSLNLSKGTIPFVDPVPLLSTISTAFQHDELRDHQDRGALLRRSMAALDQVKKTGTS
jgi:hypothetical protein